MQYLHLSLSSALRRRRRHHLHIRFIYDAAFAIERPRDRGLDHAVSRERHLKPLLSLKNLIISQPSQSIPYSQITQSKQTLELPFRPIDFIRSYPSVFQEIYPGSVNDIQPDIKLSSEVVTLSSEEDLIYGSVNYKQEVADRLLKLLMISRVNKIPICLLERLKWELGLPQDYEDVLIPEFPDYFRVVSGKNMRGNGKELELVCWSDELAVSEMEKKGAKDGGVEFSLHYSKGFEMDKKYKKWLDDWQKLPYVSPYENAAHLAVRSDESDKWTVALLHEVLNLFVGKKAERQNLLCLGEYLGLRSRFKLAFMQHPGIFYASSKIGARTVVLRDAYKRGMLIKRHPLMDMRFKYASLMNVMVQDEDKSKSTEQKSGVVVQKGQLEDDEDNEQGEDDDVEMYDDSDDESEQESEDENESRRGRLRRGNSSFEEKNAKRGAERKSNEYQSSTRFSGRTNIRADHDDSDDESEQEYERENEIKRGRFRRGVGNFEENNYKRGVERKSNERTTKSNEHQSPMRFSGRTSVRADSYAAKRSQRNSDDYEDKNENAMKRGFKRKPDDFEGKNSKRNSVRTNGRSAQESERENSTRYPRRNNVRGGDQNSPRNFLKKLELSERARSRTKETHT